MRDTIEIGGHCDPRFEALRDEFRRGFEELAEDAARGELGAALAVTLEGRTVVDLHCGYADTRRTRRWQADTLVNLYSTTKGVLAIEALHLVGQGRLDLEAPVARYWPEFAGAGKGDVRVGWLLSHRAGLPALREQLEPEALYDWSVMTTALADEAPWWQPGTKHGYHALTFGWLVGEVIRRVSGKTPGQYLREEIAGPLELDLYIGLPAREHARVADLTPVPLAPPGSDQARLFEAIAADPNSAAARAFTNPMSLLVPGLANSREWREAEIPAANGHGTALALARLYGAAVAGRDAVALLSAEVLEHCYREQSRGPDEVLKIDTRFSSGFMLSQPHASFGAGPRSFGHPGAGGSLGFADPDARLGFGYVMNRMGSEILLDPRPRALIDVLYECL